MDAVQPAIIDAFRVLLLCAFPLVGVVVLGSLVFSVLQAAMAIRDQSSLFAVRSVALILALYLFLPAIIEHIVQLTQRVWGA